MEALIHDSCGTSSDGADLLVSAFILAIQSYRRASICTPFPSGIFPSQSGDKDFASARQAAEQIPAIEELLGDLDVLKKVPVSTLKLLNWILSFPRGLELVPNPAEELHHLLPKKSSPWRMSNGLTQSVLPNFVFKVGEPLQGSSRFEEVKSRCGSFMAFHGTAMENLHSILRCGLLNLSNTEMQKNGSLYGDGVYLSTDPLVALGFSSAANSWSKSVFGRRLRCILLCEIANGEGVCFSEEVRVSKPASAGGGNRVMKELGSYVVARNSDLVRIQYIFLYKQAGEAGESSRVKKQQTQLRMDVCRVVIVLYALLLLGTGLLQLRNGIKSGRGIVQPWSKLLKWKQSMY